MAVIAGRIRGKDGRRLIALHVPDRKNRVLMSPSQFAAVANWYIVDGHMKDEEAYRGFLKRRRAR